MASSTYDAQTVVDALQRHLCPFSWQESWDNSGVQVGFAPSDVLGKVLVALDFTPEVLAEAQELGAGLVVTHHPLIFSKLRSVTASSSDPVERLVFDAVRAKVAVVAAHTCLDAALQGTNSVLCQAIGICPESPLEAPPKPTGTVSDSESTCELFGIGCVGTLTTPCTLPELARRVSAALDLPSGQVATVPAGVAAAGELVRRVAICSGSGMSLLPAAAASGAPVFLTGDVKYHDAVKAQMLGVSVIDIQHYESEVIVCGFIAQKLREVLPGLDVVVSQAQSSPFVVM
jgi:dinuclear metal center YbgI/SA1388 family protein